jgi:hypothetical protein
MGFERVAAFLTDLAAKLAGYNASDALNAAGPPRKGNTAPSDLPSMIRVLNSASVSFKAALLVCAALAVVACGGDNNDRGGNNNDQGSGNQSGPRLQWNQQAASLQQVQSLTFRLYVDNAPRPLSQAQCGGGSGTDFVCSAVLPQLGSGRFVLQLAAVLNGVESPRSEPLTWSSTGGQLTVAQELDAVSPPGEPVVACLSGSSTECYAPRAVARGLRDVSALSPAPDGRLFFVEGGMTVRVVVDGTLVEQPSLVLGDDRARIVGLAVDQWSFSQTRSVFVAWSERTPSNRVQLNVTRYREVSNTLGEGATILAGLPIPGNATASLAVDRRGLLYVAVPASGGLESSPPGSGVVLRLTRDGRVPPENELGLPAFAPGFATPSSLSVDPREPLVWLAGRDPGSSYAISVISIAPSEQPQAPRLIAQVQADEPVSFVVQRGGSGEDVPALFVLSDGRLSQALWTHDRRLAGYVPIDLGDVRLTTTAAAPGGSLYVATKTSIFELRRQ